MSEIEEVVNSISHRPWVLPTEKWLYYQEWNNALFLHWKVKASELQELLPANITLDTYHGQSWVSLVAFTMEKIRYRNTPPISAISNFHEINVRTYVTVNNKPGVYFLNIEAEKHLSCFVAKLLSGLPYEKSVMKRETDGKLQNYKSLNEEKKFQFEGSFIVRNKIEEPTLLDNWLTERYCLYLNKSDKLYRYEIHHKPWPLFNVDLIKLTTRYRFNNIDLQGRPDMMHYSTGVKVVAWKKQILK